jgi:hypothetical protein
MLKHKMLWSMEDTMASTKDGKSDTSTLWRIKVRVRWTKNSDSKSEDLSTSEPRCHQVEPLRLLVAET